VLNYARPSTLVFFVQGLFFWEVMKHMRVKSILNNSALIAFSEKSEECVLIGKGIAFNKRPGDPVDETKAEKVFNSRHARTEELIELLEDVPEKVFEMTNTIIRYANRKLGKDLDSGIYVTLLDHIHSAIERTAEGIELDFGMLTEVRMLYPKEYNIACWALDYINATMDIDIPIDESGFIVIHIIANETPNMDTGSTKKILRITKDITDTIMSYYQVKMDTSSITYTRFVTHAKYLALRYIKHEQIEQNEDSIFTLNPEAIEKTKDAIQVLNQKLKEKYGQSLSEYEKLYLTIHICRLLNIK
jgi:beta-glucoside operon transcriptional antiterminator